MQLDFAARLPHTTIYNNIYIYLGIQCIGKIYINNRKSTCIHPVVTLNIRLSEIFSKIGLLLNFRTFVPRCYVQLYYWTIIAMVQTCSTRMYVWYFGIQLHIILTDGLRYDRTNCKWIKFNDAQTQMDGQLGVLNCCCFFFFF